MLLLVVLQLLLQQNQIFSHYQCLLRSVLRATDDEVEALDEEVTLPNPLSSQGTTAGSRSTGRRLGGALLKGQSDSEVLYRGLVALGTVVSTSQGDATAVPGINGWINEAADKAFEDRVKTVIAECKKLVA